MIAKFTARTRESEILLRRSDDLPERLLAILSPWRLAMERHNVDEVMGPEFRRHAAATAKVDDDYYARPVSDEVLTNSYDDRRLLDQAAAVARYFATLRSDGAMRTPRSVAAGDTMHRLTREAMLDRAAAVDGELTRLAALNELVRSESTQLKVPDRTLALRFGIRGDNFVLKPAKSRSRSPEQWARAHAEHIHLTSLTGCPAEQPVDLDVLRHLGFGLRATDFVVTDSAPERDATDRIPALARLQDGLSDTDAASLAGGVVHLPERDDDWLLKRMQSLREHKQYWLTMADQLESYVNGFFDGYAHEQQMLRERMPATSVREFPCGTYTKFESPVVEFDAALEAGPLRRPGTLADLMVAHERSRAEREQALRDAADGVERVGREFMDEYERSRPEREHALREAIADVERIGRQHRAEVASGGALPPEGAEGRHADDDNPLRKSKTTVL